MGTQTAPYNLANSLVTNDNTRTHSQYQQRQLPPVPPLKANNDMFKVARKPLPSLDQQAPPPPPPPRSSRPVSFTPASTASTPSSYSSSSSSTVVNERRQSALGIRRSHNMLNDTEDNDSVYYNNYAIHLESDKESSTGKKFWSKPRTNEKWKELNQKLKDEKKTKQGKKLWGKIVKASQNMADRLPSLRDDRGPESDESDWEGETHVSRVIREYYEKKQQPLPHWMYDDEHTKQQKPLKQPKSQDILNRRAHRKPKLWEIEDSSQRQGDHYVTSRLQPPRPAPQARSRYMQNNYPSRESLTTYQHRNVSYDARHDDNGYPQGRPYREPFLSRTSWAAGQSTESRNPSYQYRRQSHQQTRPVHL